MNLQSLPLLQKAKALSDLKAQLSTQLPQGVHLMNVRENVWVLGCIPFLRTRLRFMVPELERTLSAFAHRPVKVEIKTAIPEEPIITPRPPPPKLTLSAETREYMRMTAESIENDKIRQILERLARS